MVLNLRPKCANPSCAASFEWLAGGRLFRFRRESMDLAPAGAKDTGANGSHPIGHFWLCERCSHIFTLAFDENQGVILKVLCPVLLAAEHPKQLTSG